ETLAVLGLRDVGRDAERLLPALLDAERHLFQRRRSAGGEDDVGAFARERVGDLLADAGADARDDRDTTLQELHLVTSLRPRGAPRRARTRRSDRRARRTSASGSGRRTCPRPWPPAREATRRSPRPTP